MEYENILKTAGLAGKILLQSGAEIYRVEETITRICEAYHVEEANAFVTPSGFFISFSKDNKTFSKVYRTKDSIVNMEKINQVNNLSRRLKEEALAIEEVALCLKSIEQQHGYSLIIKVVASGFIGGFFTLFFGGHLIDAIFAFPIGMLVQYCSQIFERNQINSIVKILCLSSVLTLATMIMVSFDLASSKDEMIIGNLMLLVPGLTITNAIRDSISGDLLSGITKGIEACIIAIALALGAGVTLSIWANLIGGTFL